MIYKRGKVYWYQFIINGRRIRESARTSNKASACRAEAERRTQLSRSANSYEDYSQTDQLLTHSFAEASSDFLRWSAAQHKPKTHQRYRVSATPLCCFFGTRKLNKVTTADIEGFKLWRLKQCSSAGVNRDLAALRYILNWAVTNDFLRKSPFRVKLLREGPGMMRVVTPEEEDLYMRHAKQKLRDIATIILHTGMRPMEVYSLRGENVILDDGYVFVSEGKSRYARRTIPLTPEVHEVFKRIWKPGYLFPYQDRHITQCRSHEKLARQLKLDFRLYDFRHTFGSRAAMAGVDLPTLKEIMGHSTIVMTMKYVHPTPEHKIQAMQKVQRFYSSHKTSHTEVGYVRK